ncbi:hypothetical protein PAXRUDRAFT_172546 [Paxillus rubicundulus Ve08.2h10]|uniref:Uncharacterized protein n=1 Tax=Paxillus rubicundulus Ve08.2h10 TaxID=930991 RepID=A0A0D0CK24_9AGAM|nr:hypothetical protein PAXRUDRAFT_172546 [Paxillus rubicundulus Ve08.2h10]
MPPSRPKHAHPKTFIRAATPHAIPQKFSSTANDDGDSATSEGSSSESSLTSLEYETNKIPKPEGEAGRPSRGGYNLEAQLAWNATSFSKLRKFVHCSIKQHLDTTKCKSQQRNQAI